MREVVLGVCDNIRDNEEVDHKREVLKCFQVFATIYETEGLDHHMAVERAHVSIKDAEI